MAKRKRAPNGDGTIRKRHDGRWESIVTVGYDEVTGKQKKVSRYGKTEREARELKTELTGQLDHGQYFEPRKETLSEWLDSWLELYVKSSCTSYTYDAYMRISNNHIKPKLGKYKLDKLSPMHIQSLYNSLSTEKGLSPKTIRGVHNVLHRSLKQAIKLQMIGSNPAELCDLPKAIHKEVQPMNDVQISEWLQQISGDKYENLYKITLLTGLRESEVLGLTWDCIDFDRNTITIKHQLHKTEKVGGVYELSPTKNKRSRTFIAAPSVMESLKDQRKNQSEMMANAGSAWSNDWGLVFTNESGKHLCQCTVYKHFKESVSAIGLDKQRFHDLRHGYVLISMESDVDIKTISANLGHATTAFTMDKYGHISAAMQQDAASKMERFYSSVKVT